MIDIENEIFTKIASELREKHPGIAVYGETVYTPSVFPCVCIEETDNYPCVRTADSGTSENHVNVTYEINVYSNKTSGKKTECKAIFTTADDVLTSLGFTRIMKNPISMDDASKYRILGRYTAVVSKNKIIYRR